MPESTTPTHAIPTHPIKLYRNAKSGHCHRVELMMALLDLPYEPVELDMASGAHKAPDYLIMNPFGQVPLTITGLCCRIQTPS
ncbi:MAG: glutathione S-transferase N-terminal domain-containing protein [Pseudomonadota bacterium]